MERAMSTKPFLFATTLAIILCIGSAPAKAQFYGGGSYISVGGPSGFLSVANGPVIAPPIVSPALPYSYVTPVNRVMVQPTTIVSPVNRVIVQPAPIVTPLPYGVYRPGWGPRVYGRPYGGVYGRPYGVYGRRGWW